MSAVREPPEISVVIPTRDRWALLRTTLGGALGQRGVHHEVIVVDDGSRDETPVRLAALGHPHLRVLRSDRVGVAAARNRGLAAARGEWVAFLDDDDLWAPLKLCTQIDTARSEGADFVYASAVHLDENGTVIHIDRAPEPADIRARLLIANAIPATSSNLMARARVLRELGGFDESFFHLADWDLALRLANAHRAAACSELLVGYLKHGRNMITLRDQNAFEELQRLISKHGSEAGAMSARVASISLSRWVALTHRRAGRRLAAARVSMRGAIRYRDLRSFSSALVVLFDPWAVARTRQAIPRAVHADPRWLEIYRDAFPISAGRAKSAG
jgi:glycosyltransferase involved in cell wall biosynthesis